MNIYTSEEIGKFLENVKETQDNVKDIVKSLSFKSDDFGEYECLLENLFDLNEHHERRLEKFSQRARIMQKIEEAINEIFTDEDY